MLEKFLLIEMNIRTFEPVTEVKSMTYNTLTITRLSQYKAATCQSVMKNGMFIGSTEEQRAIPQQLLEPAF